MPTDECKEVLDRAEAITTAAPLIDAASPLLTELVNYACQAFRRCTSAPDNLGGENEDLAPFVLYRHLIELIDTIDTLFRASCVEGAVPVLRAALEASLSLDYILRANYAQRSLMWTCGYLHSRIAAHRRLDQQTPQGHDMVTAWEREATLGIELTLGNYESATPVARLQHVLDRPGLLPIEAEYQRLRAQRNGRPPNWYQLFGGPPNRRELARAVDREYEYLALYGEWSNFSHAADASAYIRPGDAPGEMAFLAGPLPHQMPHRASLAVTMMVRATRLMIERFQNGEDLSVWYNDEIRGRWDALRNLHVNVVE